jgi:glutamate N-acetyltransferase/amino-acid N-acetyltransferase
MRRARGGGAMSVTAARGFVASGVHCGVRSSALDLALVRSSLPATGAALFTANRVQAAPVKISREHLQHAAPQAVVANSGNANAATGLRGELVARATAAEAARLLDLDAEQVLVLSTGVIGVPLPLDRILAGLPLATRALSPDGAEDAATAILTTDTRTKQAVVSRNGFTVGGMAKGSGMIHPDLATMLAVVTTDYPLEAGKAATFLRPAVDQSFNAISVDGECSTNDTVCLLANGASGIARTAATDAAFAEALAAVCGELAAQIVADGEGATFLAAIDVRGAVDRAQAKAIARRIATSPLVKTALFGRDANWGRILVAAGSAPYNSGYAHVDADLLTLVFNGVTVIDHGAPQGTEPDLDGTECTIELELGLGDGTASYLTSDLSYDYVRINADYRS